MKITYRLLIALVVCFVIWKTINHFLNVNEKQESVIHLVEKEGVSGKVKVTVYYEALCSDSRFFILKQLVPAYETIPEYVELDLVPYGKAQVSIRIVINKIILCYSLFQTIEENGKITFKCQHAALECLANKIHACGIHYITDPALQLKYIACMIDDNMIPNAAGEKVAI